MVTSPADLQLLAAGRTAEIYTWDEGRVLKLFFDFMPADEAAHEARQTHLASQAGAPAPEKSAAAPAKASSAKAKDSSAN